MSALCPHGTFLKINIFSSLQLSVFEGELQDVIPVVHTSIAGCRIIGRLCVGMSLTRLTLYVHREF